MKFMFKGRKNKLEGRSLAKFILWQPFAYIIDTVVKAIFLVQRKPINVITLGPSIFDHIIRMITLTDEFF